MSNHTITKPSFSDTEQGILKFGCSGNMFNISSLNGFFDKSKSMGFDVKYVSQGCERYSVNNQVYDVSAGSYLLLNGEKDLKVEIESGKNTKGVCITISSELIEELISSLVQPGAPQADPDLAAFFYRDHFLENQYQSGFTALGKKMQEISAAVEKNKFYTNDIHEELFFQLAEHLVHDQVRVFKQLQYIPSVKINTRKDLFRRVNRGREFIDAFFLTDLPIKEIAREASMSEYHFFRLFKKVFGASPHQYILRKRLETGKQLLLVQQPVSSVALDCGFADIFSFSKAFKKHFGVSPSALLAQKSRI